MNSKNRENRLNAGGNIGGAGGTSSLVDVQHPPALSSFAKETVLRVALAPQSQTTKKQRIMFLWERGIITSGEVEKLFDAHKLGAE